MVYWSCNDCCDVSLGSAMEGVYKNPDPVGTRIRCLEKVMSDDRVLYGTILAMMALLFGYPGWAFFIFLVSVL